MKATTINFRHLTKSLMLILAFVLILISCNKSSTNTKGPTQIKYCSSIDWSDTFGESATYTGAYVDGVYNLVYFQYHDSYGVVGGFPFHYDANNHLISDQPGVVYTYNADTLTKIAITNGSKGSGYYGFNGKGQITSASITLNDPDGSGTVTGTYTYDDNDDPVNFTASGTLSSSDGPVAINMQVTGSFLLDKTNLLPFQPEFAPLSSYFSIIPFNSKHLLDKWVVSITGTGVSAYFTAQYTYTYDSNGNVATMVYTGNTHNTYTFTYSGCN